MTFQDSLIIESLQISINSGNLILQQKYEILVHKYLNSNSPPIKGAVTFQSPASMGPVTGQLGRKMAGRVGDSCSRRASARATTPPRQARLMSSLCRLV